ncbi:substrate-binding periplasmic protein [Kordiimonas lacus]|uniref:Extracellular solute-binding protein, family 3 n=1 Tax=Kordiimonas lacus TaxID=637679 RepID=A0A1G7F4T8_9PROT|nr:transporter substrate-binding domain-containing protein [Kordiimonas lacus]SDE70948.1 extracellular solute-binding protein, family 3 [Kordiimonas lacus]
MKLALYILLCLLLAGQAAGKDTPLRAPVYHVQPAGFIEEGHLKGIFVDYLRALEQEANIPLQLTMVSYNRLIFLIEAGEADVALFLRDSAIKAAPIEKIVSLKSALISKSVIKLHDHKQLPNLTITVLRGGYFASILEKNGIRNYVPANDYLHSATLLKHDRVGAIFGIEIVALAGLAQAGLGRNQIAPPYPYGHEEIWLHMSNQLRGSDTATRIAAATRRLQKQDMYQTLAAKYLPMFALQGAKMADTKTR